MNGLGRVRAHMGRGQGRMHPMRHRPRNPFDVRRQRRVQFNMADRVFADDVDHTGARLFRVVQVRQPVRQTGPKVQQRAGRLARQPEITIGGTGRHAFLQDKYRPHAGHMVKGGNKVHLGGAGVGETGVQPAIKQGFHKAFCAVHRRGVGCVAHDFFLWINGPHLPNKGCAILS